MNSCKTNIKNIDNRFNGCGWDLFMDFFIISPTCIHLWWVFCIIRAVFELETMAPAPSSGQPAHSTGAQRLSPPRAQPARSAQHQHHSQHQHPALACLHHAHSQLTAPSQRQHHIQHQHSAPAPCLESAHSQFIVIWSKTPIAVAIWGKSKTSWFSFVSSPSYP